MKEIDALQERITDRAIEELVCDNATAILGEEALEDMKRVVASTIAEIFANATVAEIDTLEQKCADAAGDMVDQFWISEYYDDRVLGGLKETLRVALLPVEDEPFADA